MYLARIEMTGFKSFADKTVIEFDKGMTAVVGPNGSGKSNLSEAIRWVLGEQSAKSLRGSKMEDVIFNGTQDRKAVNLAKVTLVLNNEDRYLDYDFSEISITRSYNRNGESSYYINNEACRLKDIVDLLLDSGLGKNSFAMISQGKVETIFLNKPEERRSIFEEAAGVQKYQFRKTEAERKLNRSSDHLSRVKDIIHEIEAQLTPLKKQREAALIYQDKKALLQRLEISLYCYQVALYREQWTQSQEAFEQTSNDIEAILLKLQSIEKNLAEEQEEIDQLIQEIDECSEYNQQQTQAIERSKAQQQILEQRIEFSSSSQQDKQAIYDKQRAQHAETIITLETQNNLLETLNLELRELQKQLKQFKQDKHLLSELNSEQVEKLRGELIDAYQQEATVKNQVAQYAQSIQISTQRQQQLSILLEELQGQVEESNLALQQTAEAKSEFEQQFQVTREDYNQLFAELQTLRTKREDLQQRLFKQERQTQFVDSKVSALRQMQDDYAGYYAGVRAIMKNTDKLQGIEGTVADLIEVPQQYQVAIDTALGASLQHIVVTNDRAARDAIQYLKQQQAGRATFLPRENIKARQLSDQHSRTAQNHAGFVGIASKLVQFDTNNQTIIENLLGTTIVMEQLSQAQSLAKALSHQARIVTLEGDILMPGGTVTGGRNKQQTSSMLARQNELKQFEAELQEAISRTQQLEQEWQIITQRDTALNEQLEQLRSVTSQANVQLQQLQQQHLQAEHQLKQCTQEYRIAQDELRQLDTQLEEAHRMLVDSQQSLEHQVQLIQALNHDLQQLTLSEDDRQAQLQKVEQSISQLSTQTAVKEVEFRQAEEKAIQLSEYINELETAIQAHESEQSQGQIDFEALTLQLQKLKEQIELDEVQATASREKLHELRERRQLLNTTYREHEQMQRELSLQSQKLHQQSAKLQAQIEKFEAFIDNHLAYLSQEYQLSYEAASKLASPVEEAQQVSQDVKQLKRSMEQLGPINLAAIEDYEVLNERYQHLLEQQEDLLTAMAQLQETMDEMDTEVIKRFSETFTQINHQFQRTFRKLFGGGEASLELTNPSDILTTGIDIIAQPPGKRKQNLALLSGGERAFTAIALLFAILETKPVPFCVLDEVEAALDDANVYRYGQYLQNFTENTQFIVITHRKGTMENADVLYGVTMEQSGISKLASVRLSEANYE